MAGRQYADEGDDELEPAGAQRGCQLSGDARHVGVLVAVKRLGGGRRTSLLLDHQLEGAVVDHAAMEAPQAGDDEAGGGSAASHLAIHHQCTPVLLLALLQVTNHRIQRCRTGRLL